MRISFVVPAYNEELYLADCIESILRETSRCPLPTEIIVVDNASTDGTAVLARSYPGVRLVQQPIRGLTHARQAGFEASSGSLIANVDADSRLIPGWIDQVLAEFDRNPNMLALSGPLVYYDLPALQSVLVRIFYGIAWTVYSIVRFILRTGSMVQGGNFVVARQGLERIGGFNLAISFYGEDTDLARRLSDVGRVRFTLALRMLSSARRLHHEGLWATAWRYALNYFWTTFRERPYTTRHADIREADVH